MFRDLLIRRFAAAAAALLLLLMMMMTMMMMIDDEHVLLATTPTCYRVRGVRRVALRGPQSHQRDLCERPCYYIRGEVRQHVSGLIIDLTECRSRASTLSSRTFRRLLRLWPTTLIVGSTMTMTPEQNVSSLKCWCTSRLSLFSRHAPSYSPLAEIKSDRVT